MLNYGAVFQEFSPGSNGRMTTMGVYIRDLLLGQVRYLYERMLSCLSSLG